MSSLIKAILTAGPAAYNLYQAGQSISQAPKKPPQRRPFDDEPAAAAGGGNHYSDAWLAENGLEASDVGPMPPYTADSDPLGDAIRNNTQGSESFGELMQRARNEGPAGAGGRGRRPQAVEMPPAARDENGLPVPPTAQPPKPAAPQQAQQQPAQQKPAPAPKSPRERHIEALVKAGWRQDQAERMVSEDERIHGPQLAQHGWEQKQKDPAAMAQRKREYDVIEARQAKFERDYNDAIPSATGPVGPEFERAQAQADKARRERQDRIASGQGFANVEQQGAMFQEGQGLRRGIAAQEQAAAEGAAKAKAHAQSISRTEEMRRENQRHREAGYPGLPPEARAARQVRDQNSDAQQAMLDRERYIKDDYRRNRARYEELGITPEMVAEKYDRSMGYITDGTDGKPVYRYPERADARNPGGSRIAAMQRLRMASVADRAAKNSERHEQARAARNQEARAIRYGVPVSAVVAQDEFLNHANNPGGMQAALFGQHALNPNAGYGNAAVAVGKAESDRQAVQATTDAARDSKKNPVEKAAEGAATVASTPVGPGKIDAMRTHYRTGLPPGTPVSPEAENQHVVAHGAEDARKAILKNGPLSPEENLYLRQWTAAHMASGLKGDKRAKYLAWCRALGVQPDDKNSAFFREITGEDPRTWTEYAQQDLGLSLPFFGAPTAQAGD